MTDLTHEGQTSMDLASPVNPTFARPMTPTDALQGFIAEFESLSLPICPYKGQPSTLAREFGRQAGFSSDGKKFLQMIRNHWSDFFVEGAHFVVLTGKKREDYIKTLELVSYRDTSSLKRAGSFMVLLFPGIWAAISKCEARIGVAFSHLMSTVIMPRFSTGEAVSIESIRSERTAGADAAPAPMDAKLQATMLVERRRMEKIRLDSRKLDAQLQERKAKALLMLADRRRGSLPESVIHTLELKAAEVLMGEDLPLALPALEADEAGWRLVSQIAREQRVSDKRISMCIAEVEKKGQQMRGGIEGISSVRMIPGKGDNDGTYETNVYSPKAEALILDELEIWREEQARQQAIEEQKARLKAQESMACLEAQCAKCSDPEALRRLECLWRTMKDGVPTPKTAIRLFVQLIDEHGEDDARLLVKRAKTHAEADGGLPTVRHLRLVRNEGVEAPIVDADKIN